MQRTIITVTITSMMAISTIALAEDTGRTHFQRLQTVQEEKALLEKLLAREELLQEQSEVDQYSPWVYKVCGQLTKHHYCRSYRQKWAGRAAQRSETM